MSTQRWNDPWTTPRGAAPERPPGEPGPAQLALVHLAFFFGVSAVGALAPAVAGSSEQAAVATLLVLALVFAVAGLLVRARRTSMDAWLADLLLLASVGYLFGGAGSWASLAGASEDAALLTAALVALPWALAAYALHRRIWTQVAAVLSLAVALVAAFAVRPELPRTAAAAYLLLLGAFLAVLAVAGVARPVRSGCVLAALLATAGARVLVDEHTGLGSLTAVAVLGLVVVGVLRAANRSLVPMALVSGVVLGPPVLQPLLGTAQAISLSLALAAAGVSWLALDLTRRSVRHVQTGGVFAAALAATVASLFLLIGDGPYEELVELGHALAVAAFFAAAVMAGRRPAAVVAGLLLVQELPRATSMGSGRTVEGLVALAALAAVVGLLLRLRSFAPRPAAAEDQQEVALAGEGQQWVLVSPYPQVFDAVVGVLTAAAVPLQLVDRAAGRVVAGDPLRPVLAVAVWGLDPVRTSVRAVGAPHDTARFRAEVDDWVSQLVPRQAV